MSPAQRDIALRAPSLPRALGYALHHAPVRNDKLGIQVTRAHLDALIAAVAAVTARTKPEEIALDGFSATWRAWKTVSSALNNINDPDPSEPFLAPDPGPWGASLSP